MRKGSKEAKAWGRKMQRLRKKRVHRPSDSYPKTRRRKTRKYTTRKRRTTRRGDLTLKRKRAYPRKSRRKTDSWSW